MQSGKAAFLSIVSNSHAVAKAANGPIDKQAAAALDFNSPGTRDRPKAKAHNIVHVQSSPSNQWSFEFYHAKENKN